MKPDSPKSVAFKDESFLGDLKRKFCRQETRRNQTLITVIVRSSWILKFKYVDENLPQVSYHGEPNHVSDTEQRLSTSDAPPLLRLSLNTSYPF